MHRQILEACIPCLTALAVGFLLLWLTIRLCGARFNWRRLTQAHRCQQGGVQSLAFVVTLPLFIMITLFIVQVSQLMLGTMVVNYAAFTSARAAIVWIPADMGLNNQYLRQNKLPPPIADGSPVSLSSESGNLTNNYKYQKIYQAAAMACAPISPSTDYGFTHTPFSQDVTQATQQMYDRLTSATNQRIPARLNSKLAYSFENTTVRLEFQDRDSRQGPTYNPNYEIILSDGRRINPYDPHEVGWQDPVTVTVTHEFALLPGPGRFLAPYLVQGDGTRRINSTQSSNGRPLYTTPITASATLTNEGFKSVVPYVYQSN